MDVVVDVVRRSREDGRVSALNDAIDAAREYGHDGLVPVLEMLRDRPRIEEDDEQSEQPQDAS